MSEQHLHSSAHSMSPEDLVEPDNVPALRLTILVALMTFAVVASIAGVWRLMVVVSRDAVTERMLNVTSPELAEQRKQTEAYLTRFEPVAGKEGVYRMPIDRAMALLVQKPELLLAGAPATATAQAAAPAAPAATAPADSAAPAAPAAPAGGDAPANP